ncbi:MAG: hypothetical protein H0U71_05640 [Gammaproteobacteria bacterium]|nr:hypothetical protein [Gammaproteobacteria bacterium]
MLVSMRGRVKKIIANTSHYVYQKNFYSEFMGDQNFYTQQLQIVLPQLNLDLAKVALFFKNSRGDTSTVALVQMGHDSYVIKRYNIKNFFHGLKIQFRRSHGYRSFCYAHFLKNKNVLTIKPVAVMQKKWGIFKFESYFISRYEEGMRGCQYFNDASGCQTTWTETIDAIVELIKTMHANSIYHGDFHFGNMVINNNKPILLDFDRIKIVKNRNRFAKLHRKDLNNFLRYLIRNPLANMAFQSHVGWQDYLGALAVIRRG